MDGGRRQVNIDKSLCILIHASIQELKDLVYAYVNTNVVITRDVQEVDKVGEATWGEEMGSDI